MKDAVAELTEELNTLLDARAAAISEADADEVQSDVEKLRTEIVDAKLAGADVSALVAERDRLQRAQRAPVIALQAKVNDRRRRLARAQSEAAAAALSHLSDEELAQLLTSVSNERREIKRQVRAVRVAIDSRAAVARIKDLAAGMSAEDRAALVAELQE